MKLTPLLLALGALLLLYQLNRSHDEMSKPYDVAEAYEVYSAILPATNPLFIRGETRTHDYCLFPLDAQSREVLATAIASYHDLNAKRWLLQRKFDNKQRYELLPEEELDATFQKGIVGYESRDGWGKFFKRHSDSQGWIELSAVGFNTDKTIAIVYMGYHCGEGCEGGEYRALEKRDGKWQLFTGKGKWNHCIWSLRTEKA